MPQALSLLLDQVFGYSTFRLGQLDIIQSVLEKRDTFAVMPTGSGKSLCFQIPAIHIPGITLVVSPLISLMQDQVGALRKKGVPAGCLHSDQTMAEKKRVFQEMKESRHYLLYLSPERVQKEGFLDWFRRAPISLVAIDEAHCVSKWGHDFREDYHRLQILRENRQDIPILALTATATPQVLADTTRRLGLRDPARFIYGFYRQNLFYQVREVASDYVKLSYVREALQKFSSGRALLYCATRKQTQIPAASLENEFEGVGFYHAGLSADERAKMQEAYDSGRIRILAATNAFGMGIDHPNVRLVIHFQMPGNIESLYQEMGRAGRDGEPSTCLLLYSKKDKGLQSYFIRDSKGDPQSIRQKWRGLDAIVQYAEGGECRHSEILTYFRDAQKIRTCGHCDSCDPKSERNIFVEHVPTRMPMTLKISKGKTKKVDSAALPLTPQETRLSEYLRLWRKDYAEERDVPAFLVFSNRTLEDLVRKSPQSKQELEQVYGFGAQRVEHLGDALLEKIRAFAQG